MSSHLVEKLKAMQLLPEDVIDKGQVSEIQKGTHLFLCGEPIDRLFFVIEGELHAVRHQINGQKSIMMRATSGEFFASASLSLDVFPCDGYVPMDSQLWSIGKADFYQMLSMSAELGKLFSLALTKELKKQCGRVERYRLPSAKERILHFISCETADGKHLQLSCSLQHWAEELGIEAESLYRTLKQMETAQIIQRNKREITLIK